MADLLSGHRSISGFVFLLLFCISCSESAVPERGSREIQSIGQDTELVSSVLDEEQGPPEDEVAGPVALAAAGCFKPGSVISLHSKTIIGGEIVPAGTELLIDEADNGNISFKTNPENDSVKVKDLGAPPTTLKCDDFTVVQSDEDGGLMEYDVITQVAGKTVKKKKKGRVTYCYRAVKNLRPKLGLTGGSAYMAYAQLKRKKLKQYSYKSAPRGSICVFGRGGKVTPSGGHKHGHIGIKGMGGVVSVESGFKLGRPFLGCFK